MLLFEGGWDGTRRQAELLQENFQRQGLQVTVRHAMRYGQPSVASVLDELKAGGVQRVLVLPLYPQYSSTTTGSIFVDRKKNITSVHLRTGRIDSANAGFFAAGQDSNWHFDAIQEWIRCVHDPSRNEENNGRDHETEDGGNRCKAWWIKR